MKKLIGIIIICVILIGGYFTTKSIYPLKYKDSITKYSKEFNVDPYLICSIIFSESGFRDSLSTYSPGGKNGVMQISDDTAQKWAKEIGLKDFDVKSISNPDINIKLGSWYLSKISKNSKNTEDLVEKWMTRNNNSLNDDAIKNYSKTLTSTEKMYKILYKNLK
ncbi:transglycosylase SLT domain-containing protein [Clostridium rectalis]|uniref:transglycosylase SLT domain-containing protein n=1 Tax=Clostridium rectalis TaxID=2040295 RepID=UPI0013DDDA6B|nr:transglycosylase SLT domain-containing protein [Clostridium rectalis]